MYSLPFTQDTSSFVYNSKQVPTPSLTPESTMLAIKFTLYPRDSTAIAVGPKYRNSSRSTSGPER